MLDELKRRVYEANMELFNRKLAIYTWGNVSGIDREKGLVVIKPSGVPYETMKAEDMVVLSLETGEVVEGDLRPSSDTPTHLELYRAWPQVGGVVHTHSPWAVSWAQAGRGIPAYGTTHADYFYGEIPCTRDLTEEEINEAYEFHTATVIKEAFADRNPMHTPGVLCKSHGPFTWGKTPEEAVYNSAVLEQVAMMAAQALTINPNMQPAGQYIIAKHFLRKHGPNAYYGQEKKN